MNLPNYEFLSAPLWLVTALHLLTLALHFVAMNFLFGGVLIVLHSGVHGRWDDPTARRFAGLFPVAMAATVTLGIAPLLFVQLVYHRLIYSAAIVSGWFWLILIAAVIVGYYSLYRAAAKAERIGTTRGAALWLALLCLLYVSATYSSIFSLAEKPELMRSLYAANQTGHVWNPAIGDYALRWLHMVLGAATVGGFFVGLLGRDRPEAYELGKQFFVGGMVGAALAGMGYLLSQLPILPAFMKSPAVWVVSVAILLSIASVHFFFTKNFCVSGTLLFVSLLGMVFTRHTVRLLRLAGQLDPSAMRIAPQWGPLAMFLVCFVIALGVLAYMLRLLAVANRSAT